MSGNEEIVKRAAALLDRADELRAEARQMLEPLHRARGWRGSADALSALMNFDLPERGKLYGIRKLRRDRLLAAAQELDAKGIGIAIVASRKRLIGKQA